MSASKSETPNTFTCARPSIVFVYVRPRMLGCRSRCRTGYVNHGTGLIIALSPGLVAVPPNGFLLDRFLQLELQVEQLLLHYLNNIFTKSTQKN
ncbi:hypothetical protein DPMN_166922 [Dreissena polymorpha]|uniref:Uncharacterized protein n=1 Tax=Dreissena polymorpha TaxID=45954 RepID=A0A9D4EZW7_DREPO|nr:hypothetical protein DPMN_166922 [Dreissena polymorpha]